MIRSKDNFFETSDNAILYFEDYGSGEPIVLIHGFLCSSKFFCKNVRGLSNNNRLILLDLRGHGSSCKTLMNNTMKRNAQDVKELLDYLQLENVNLFGWSLGAGVAMSYYEQFGEYRLKSIGSIDNEMYPFSPEEWNCHSLHGYNMDGMNAAMERAISERNDYCYGFAQKVFKSNPKPEDVEMMAEEMKKIPPWIAFALYSDYMHRDYTAIMPQINIPFFIGCADSDCITKGIEMGRYYKKLVNNKCFYYEFNEGHVMFYENPENFNCVILQFINDYALNFYKNS